jgi:type I restriction enzyme S subunit
MKKYDSYKDSGIEWIGEIPNHWEVKRLKYVADSNPSNVDKKSKDDEEEIFLCNYVDVYKNEFISSEIKFMKATASEGQIKKFILEKGDVIATKDSESPDDIAVPTLVSEDFENVICGYHLNHIKPREISGFYLFRLFQSPFLKSYFETSANGVTRYGIGAEKFQNVQVLVPASSEQTAIATYLDRKTTEIDELIADKKRLLKLYEEEKTAIINHAVTKGIDPDVPMRDSGIEWLEEIPEHWEVKKLKYVANSYPSNVDKKSKEDEQEVLLCNYVDVYKNDFITSDLPFMKATASVSQIEKFKLKKGDVIATKDSETPDDIAVPALVLENFKNAICGYHLNFIRPLGIKGEYLFRFFQSQYTKGYFYNAANGVTRYGIGTEKFSNFSVAVPPIEEQRTIVCHIGTECNRIEKQMERTKKLIDLLTEYRTALISEVVTGKVKVID